MGFAKESGERNRRECLFRMKKYLTKCHIYIGLFFMADIWLLALTGLLLNHPHWGVNDYREETEWSTESVETVSLIETGDPQEKAEQYMQQLGIESELLGTRDLPDKGEFHFNTKKPGQDLRIVVDTAAGEARIEQKEYGFWGTVNQLHIFGEMKRFAAQKESTTWFATKLWVASMDGLAVGLILLVFTGIYMWLKTKKIITGGVSLLCGVGIALFFLLL